jgi:transcriptional regulator with PAS, ATPase and Fis domain
MTKQPLPSTQQENPAIVRQGLFLVTVHTNGMRAFRLRPGKPLTVGRSPDCDVTIDTQLLSRAHFQVSSDGPIHVKDLGSSNGTKVNGRLITSNVPTPIDIGSLIEAGGVFFVLKDHVPEEAVPESVAAMSLAKASHAPLPEVVVADDSMKRLHELLELVARSNILVLVTGETGVGKEVISRAVHERSARSGKAFVSLNCAALPETLLESELFGYERGAFTGATQAKPGLIESAHEGTFFLDEVGEMPLPTQAKLLRVLENGVLTRVGSVKPRAVDVRFIAATNRDLPALVARGEFRRDLYYRLNGITIPVPPLRERPQEIAPLARHFLEAASRRAGRAVPRISPDVVPLLLAHPWPGNIRELRNVMDRSIALCLGGEVQPAHVLLDPPMPETPSNAGAPSPRAVVAASAPPAAAAPAATPATPSESPGRLWLGPDEERQLIEETLAKVNGNQVKAAELLGISRRTLINRLDAYAIKRPRKRSDPT